MNKSKRIILTLLSLIGLALAIELCVVYYNANFVVDAKPSICNINDMMDCDGVAKTGYSQFLGVPLSLWGVILYLFFLFMTYVDKLREVKFFPILKVFKNPLSYIFCVALFSFCVSITLGCISVFKINAICIFCFMTYFVNLLIAIVSKTKGVSVYDEIKTSINDFVEAIKDKKNAFWFALVVLAAVSTLAYTTVSNIFSPQIVKQNELKSQSRVYKGIVKGNTMGSDDASIVINEYIDFNCRGCFMVHLYLHRIMDEFTNVKVIQHNLPLEQICNANMQVEGHKGSCLKSSYALAAAKQNKYWEMADILFFDNPMTEKKIIEQARLLDIDVKKLKEDANSEEIKQEIQDSIKNADDNQVEATPTLIVGVNKFVGIATYPEFKQLILQLGGIEKENNNE